MSELVAQFPDAELLDTGLHHAVFWFAEAVEAALDEQVQGERKPGGAIGQDAVVDVAAGGEVAREGRRLLPDLASAASVLVVAVAERLMRDKPESLDEKDRKQPRRDALRQIEMEAAETGKPVGHHDNESNPKSKWQRWGT